MSAWLVALLALGIGVMLGGLGVAVAVLLRRGRAHDEQKNAETRAELLAEQMRQRVADEGRLKEAFAALGSQVLAANSAQFNDLASRTLQIILAEAKGDVEKRHQAIDGLVKPVRELLEKHSSAVTEIERKREVAYRGLEEQIKSIATSHERLGLETRKLVAALRRPEQRGRWGEMQLRNAVELAGMTEHCDFTVQQQTDDPDSRDRPDMKVNLPGGGIIVVDAKVALDAYLESLEAEADRPAQIKRHAQQVEDHFRKLAAKRYWDRFDRTPRLVVMFMPLESALGAALDVKPELHADAMRSHVLIATPTLLVAMLRAIAYGWQQEDVAANARRISDVGRELHERLAGFVAHMEEVGKSLKHGAHAYNQAVGSLERRVLPSARKLRDLHATTEGAIEAPRTLDVETKPLAAPELKPISSD